MFKRCIKITITKTTQYHMTYIAYSNKIEEKKKFLFEKFAIFTIICCI